jgi:hypothetical protein
VRYVLKPPLEYNAEHLAIWLEAKKRARLPALSGTHGIPQKRTWSNPSRLRVYFAKPPTKATSRHRSGPLNALSTKVSNRRTFTISKPSRKTYVGLEIRPLNTFRCEVAHRQPRERGPPPADQPTARTLDFCERNIMTNEISTTRAAVATITADLAALDTQAADLDRARAQKRAALDLARAVLASATAQAQERDREPQDASELQDALENLRRRIASAPARSHTAGQARNLIARLEKPNCPLSTAEKLSTIKDTLRRFRDGIQYVDAIHFGPDTWKS